MLRFSRTGTPLVVAIACALPAMAALAPDPAPRHDPRTTAKTLSQGLFVDGAGRFDVEYKALHWNPEMFERAGKTQRFMDFLNAEVWGKLGSAKLGFELRCDDVVLAPGEYKFGINMTPAEEFSVVFWPGPDFKEKKVLPLAIERDQRSVPYLTVALMATDDVDTFELEARCGPWRGTTDLMVPYLGEEHEHEEDGEGGGEDEGGGGGDR